VGGKRSKPQKLPFSGGVTKKKGKPKRGNKEKRRVNGKNPKGCGRIKLFGNGHKAWPYTGEGKKESGKQRKPKDHSKLNQKNWDPGQPRERKTLGVGARERRDSSQTISHLVQKKRGGGD